MVKEIKRVGKPSGRKSLAVEGGEGRYKRGDVQMDPAVYDVNAGGGRTSYSSWLTQAGNSSGEGGISRNTISRVNDRKKRRESEKKQG